MRDLTSGSVTRHLLKTTSFMLVTMIFQTLYFLADLYWVGRLGTEAIAAVAVAGNLTFVVLAATQMLSVGTTTLVSHAAGRKDQARANFVFNQSLLLGVAAGAVFYAASMITRGTYATALAADAATAALALAYLAWFIPAMALQFPMVSMSAALRGTGNFRPGMIVQTSTVVINIVLTPMLIFGWPIGPPMGVSGAALATFLSLVIGTAWLALYFRGTSAYLHVRPKEWTPRLRVWGEMLKVGLPAGTEFALMAVYLLIVYVVIRPFGAAAQAGFGIGLRIVQASFLPVVALGIAVAPVAGQNFGARLAGRVRQTFRSAVFLAGGVMFAAAAVCVIVPRALMALFASDPGVIRVGEEYLRIVALNYVASGVVFVSSSMFQAMGNTVPPLIASFGRLVLVAMPVLLLARLPGFQLAWIWWLSAASIWVQMGINLLLLKREFARRLDVPAPVA
ncbi:MAG TPA: MATE family efflux transporter [Vicinamibacterales bacterium]|nr:MATE family efflux transporter [Vicinamibacterales bacterium]